MKIIVQQKKVDKYTGELINEEVTLDNDDFDGSGFIRLAIGDKTWVDLFLTDLFTATEAFHRQKVRSDKRDMLLSQIDYFVDQKFHSAG